MHDRKKDEYENESLTVRRFAKNTAIAGATVGTVTSICLDWLLKNDPHDCSRLLGKPPKFASAFLIGSGGVAGGAAGLLLGAGIGITYFKVKKKMTNNLVVEQEKVNKFK